MDASYFGCSSTKARFACSTDMDTDAISDGISRTLPTPDLIWKLSKE